MILMVFASFFINGLVLFLMARPVRALSLLGVYVASVVTLMAACTAVQNEALFTTTMCSMILGPACLTAIEHHWHVVALRQPPVLPVLSTAAGDETADIAADDQVADLIKAASPRFIGIRQLEELRNAVEIAVFHKKDSIEFLAKLSYFAAGLDAVMAALDRAWLDVSISLLLVGLTYTVRAHESRTFSIIYILFGLLIAGEFVQRAAHGIDSMTLGLPVLIITLGVSLTVHCFALARLRRFRARIHLEPADHLRDL